MSISHLSTNRLSNRAARALSRKGSKKQTGKERIVLEEPRETEKEPKRQFLANQVGCLKLWLPWFGASMN